MPTKPLKLGLTQHACGEHVEANVALAIDMIRHAASQGAQLVATQELFANRYFCQVEDAAMFQLAETIPGPTSERLCTLAKELGIEITASLFEKRAPGLFHNTSIVIDPAGNIVGKYRKMHIPDDPRFFEKFYFTPGDLGWQSVATRYAKAGLLVCWDQWYPEAARLTALRGAEILFYPTAIGWWHGESAEDKQQQRAAWQTMQRSHAISNGVYVTAINRVGREDDLEFWGGSFVCDPGGTIIAEASATDEEVLVVDCDLSRIDNLREGWPFFRDRRIDAYDEITRRFIDE